MFEREEPLVLRGLVSGWPAIPSGEGNLDELEGYLSKFWTEKPVTAYVALRRPVDGSVTTTHSTVSISAVAVPPGRYHAAP